MDPSRKVYCLNSLNAITRKSIELSKAAFFMRAFTSGLFSLQLGLEYLVSVFLVSHQPAGLLIDGQQARPQFNASLIIPGSGGQLECSLSAKDLADTISPAVMCEKV